MQNHYEMSSKNICLNPKHVKLHQNYAFDHVLCVFRPDSGGRPQSEFGRIRTAVPNLSSAGCRARTNRSLINASQETSDCNYVNLCFVSVYLSTFVPQTTLAFEGFLLAFYTSAPAPQDFLSSGCLSLGT